MKFTLQKKESKLFQISDQIESAEDFTNQKLKKYGSDILVEIPLKDIIIENQVRSSFSEESITQLATSIKKEGLLYPILVMKHPTKDKKYVLLVGESRFKAFQKLKKETIPARVKPFIQNNGDRKLIQLTENIQRKNLNAIDLADSFMSIKDDLNITLEQLSKRVGRSLSYIKQLSQIHNLSAEEKNSLKDLGFKELRNYTISKKTKSIPGILSKKTDQLPLFKETKTSLKLSSFSLNFKKESKDTLQKKIDECEQFLKLAKKKFKNL